MRGILFCLSSYTSGKSLVSTDGERSQRPEQHNTPEQYRSVYNTCKQKHMAGAGDTHGQGKRVIKNILQKF